MHWRASGGSSSGGAGPPLIPRRDRMPVLVVGSVTLCLALLCGTLWASLAATWPLRTVGRGAGAHLHASLSPRPSHDGTDSERGDGGYSCRPLNLPADEDDDRPRLAPGRTGDGGDCVLLYVAVLTSRSRAAADRRNFMRRASWPSLVRESPLYANVRYRFFVGAAAGSTSGSGSSGAGATAQRASATPATPSFAAANGGSEATQSDAHRQQHGDADGRGSSASAAHGGGGAFLSDEELAREASAYGDLTVLTDTGDGYAQLTDKVVSIIRWVSGRVRDGSVRTEFVMKTDDDVWLNVQQLRAYLLHNRFRFRRAGAPGVAGGGGGAVIGSIGYGVPVIRDPTHRWADPTYPLDAYAPYPYGGGYVFSVEAVLTLDAYSRRPDAVRYANEDVNVGTWVYRLAGPLPPLSPPAAATTDAAAANAATAVALAPVSLFHCRFLFSTGNSDPCASPHNLLWHPPAGRDERHLRDVHVRFTRNYVYATTARFGAAAPSKLAPSAAAAGAESAHATPCLPPAEVAELTAATNAAHAASGTTGDTGA